jgi:anti-sigma-K factor RskA
MVHEDYKEMIPARALLALDAGEDRALSEHLSQCPECRRELDDWLATSAALALTAGGMEPSPQVRERLMAEIHTDNRRASLTDRVSEPSRVTPFVPRRKTWSAASSFGAIAAVILFAALIVGVVVLWRENRATQDQLNVVLAQLKNMELDLQRKNEFVELVRSPGSHLMDLSGTNMAPGAVGKIAFNSNGKAMLMAQGLPAAPAGKEYQLWFIVGGKPMPGKSFSTDTSGSGMTRDEVPSEAMNSAVFAITLEPKGGVPAPTGKIYLSSGT